MHFVLERLEIAAFLGVPDEERAQKQVILASIAFDLETHQAQVSDDIRDTVDYQNLYDFIKSFPGDRPYKLLETLYKELLEALREAFPQLENLELTLTKKPFPDATVTISASQS